MKVKKLQTFAQNLDLLIRVNAAIYGILFITWYDMMYDKLVHATKQKYRICASRQLKPAGVAGIYSNFCYSASEHSLPNLSLYVTSTQMVRN